MNTPIADMVEKMLSGGCPVDMIVLAVRTAEACSNVHPIVHPTPVDTVADRRRAWDRERKREERQSQVLKAPRPPDVHPIPPDNENSALSYLLPSSESKEREEKKEKKERKSGIVCPPDFHPTQRHYDHSQTKYGSPALADTACERMKNWSHANANRAVARKLDWGRALFDWIDREAEKGRVNGHRSRTVSEAADELIARAEAAEREAGTLAIDAEYHRVEDG